MAVTPEIGTGNLDLQQQLNNLIAERTKILEQHNALMTTHNQLISALSSKIKEQQGAAGGAAQANNEVAKALEEVTKNTEKAAVGTSKLTTFLKAAAKGASSAWKGIKAFAGGLKTVASAAVSSVKGLMKLGGWLLKIGQSVLAFPFAMLNGLIEMANTLPSGPSPIALQMEEIRKVFGDLATNEGKLVKSSLTEIKAEMNNVAGTGLSVRKMFGAGPEGLAAAMKEFQEIAVSLGPSLNRLQDDIKGNIPELLALTRGFTGSADATAAMLKHAKSLGKDGTQEIIKATGMAQRMGRQYGISAKIIGKSVGEMSKDVSNFGSMSTKQMTAAAVYTSKLGIEIQDLSNVMNKFLNFEDAAKGAAEMAQAFGMNVDTIELMKGGPEAIEAMRKAFFASGKSIENLSNAERKLLEQQTGLTGASLEAAFAANSQGTSYDEIAASAEDAGSVQERQIEVMKELAKSIDRVLAQGGDTFKSFGDAMTRGFTDGMMRAGPMYELLRNIRTSLRQTYWIFRDIGKQFVTSFPGLQKFLSSLAKIFNPAGISFLMLEFGANLKKLMSDISDPKKKDGAVARFLDNIKKSFKSFFSLNGPAISGVKEGGKSIISAVFGIFVQLMTVGLDVFARGIERFLESDFAKSLSSGVSGAGSALGAAFSRLWDALGKAWDTIWPVLQPKLEELGSWLKEKFMGLLSSIFGSDAGGVVGAAASFFSGPAGIAIAGAMTAGIAPALIGGLKDMVKSSFSSIFSSGEEGDKKDSSADAIKNAAEQAEAVASKGVDWKGAAGKIIGLTAFIGGMLVLMPYFIDYLKYIAPKLAGLSLADLLMSSVVFAAAVGLFIGALSILEKLDKNLARGISIGAIIKGIIGVGTVVLVVGAIGSAVSWMLEDIKGENFKKQTEALDDLVTMGIKMSAAGAALGLAVTITGGLGGIAIAAGIAAVGAVIMSTVTALLPVIDKMSSIKLQDPASFEKVSKTIVTLASMGAEFASAIGSIMENMPEPGWFTSAEEDSAQFEKSMDLVNEMIKNITAPITIAKNTINEIMTALSSSSFSEEKIKSTTGLVSALLPPIFEFMGKSIDVFTNISKNAKDSEGNISTLKINHMATAFSSITKSLFSADLITIINETVSSLVNAIGSLVIPPDFYKKAKVIEGAMKMVTSFADLGTKIIDMMKAQPISDESAGVSSFEGLNLDQVFTALQKVSESIPNNMQTIVAGFSGLLSMPVLATKGISAKIATVKSMFEMAAAFVKILTDMPVTLDGQFAAKINIALTQMQNLFGEKSSTNARVKEALNGIGSIGVLGKVVPGFNVTDMKRVSSTFTEASSLVNGIALSGEKNLKSQIRIAIDNIIELFGSAKMKEAINRFGDISNLSKEKINVAGLSGLKVAADFSVDAGNAISGFVKAMPLEATELTNLINAYVDGINSIVDVGERFATSKSFDALVQLTDVLSNTQTVTVDAQGVSYTLNVSVTIDAEKLAENLVQTGKLKETLGLQ